MHYRAIFALLLLTFSLAGAQDIPTYTVSYGDITFSFRGTVATGVDVAEEADGVNVSPFAMFPAESPAHTLFTLTGYVPNPAEDLNRDRFHAPEIRVYRIEDVMTGALDDATYGSEVELLRELLETRPALDTLEHLPFLPLIPGVQTLHTRGHYLENDSISGIAYLTHRADRAGLILEAACCTRFRASRRMGAITSHHGCRWTAACCRSSSVTRAMSTRSWRTTTSTVMRASSLSMTSRLTRSIRRCPTLTRSSKAS